MTVGYNTTPCTTQLASAVVDPTPLHPKLDGRRVVILDTPGFDEDFKEDKEILQRISEWLEKS